jgi:hypothetical protein
MGSHQYILDGHTPVRCDDLYAWGRWLETARESRIVARTTVREGVDVSTVFLGLDHRFDDGPPLLFETMVFRNGNGDEEERYSTWDEAVTGHKAMVARVQAEQP